MSTNEPTLFELRERLVACVDEARAAAEEVARYRETAEEAAKEADDAAAARSFVLAGDFARMSAYFARKARAAYREVWDAVDEASQTMDALFDAGAEGLTDEERAELARPPLRPEDWQWEALQELHGRVDDHWNRARSNAGDAREAARDARAAARDALEVARDARIAHRAGRRKAGRR